MARTKHTVASGGPKLVPKEAPPRYERSRPWRPPPPLRMVPPEPRPGDEEKKRKKRAYRWRPGTMALREIRQYQRSTRMLLPFVPFVRLVKEITSSFSTNVNRWTPEALVPLQAAAEYHLVDLFEKANLCAIHANAKGHRACQAYWGALVMIHMEDVVCIGEKAKPSVILMEYSFWIGQIVIGYVHECIVRKYLKLILV